MDETPLLIPRKDPLEPLRFMEFRSYLSMRFFFTFAIQMQAVVIGFYIYQLTGDKLALGLIGLAEAVPAIGIALYGGYIADKSEKRGLILKIYAVVLLCSTAIAILVAGGIHQVGKETTVVLIYTMIFAMGAARGFLGPTTFAIMGNVVPRYLYPRAATWSSSTWQTATIIGALTGGICYGFYGIFLTYMIIVALLGVALIAGAFLKRHPATFVPTESISKSLKEGITFVFRNKMMLGAMSLDLFSVFFGGAVALLPVFANDILKVGPQGLGLMRAAVSLGSVLTMLVMIIYPPTQKPWRNLLFAVTGFGASIICYGLSKNFYLTLFFLFCEGAFDSVSVVIRSTIMQLLTPDPMRGRVSAVNSMFIGSSNEIGAFESGLTAKLMGTVPAVVFGGTMTLGIAIATWLKTKNLLGLKLDEIKPPDPTP